MKDELVPLQAQLNELRAQLENLPLTDHHTLAELQQKAQGLQATLEGLIKRRAAKTDEVYAIAGVTLFAAGMILAKFLQ